MATAKSKEVVRGTREKPDNLVQGCRVPASLHLRPGLAPVPSIFAWDLFCSCDANPLKRAGGHLSMEIVFLES